MSIGYSFTAIPNWFFDLLPYMSASEVSIGLTIFRQTAGYHRRSVILSYTAIQTFSGVKSHSSISKALKKLEWRGVIIRETSKLAKQKITACLEERTITLDGRLTPKIANLSPIEKSFWENWQKLADLPLVPQYPVLDGKYRLDFAHLETKTAIELDGFQAHHSPTQIAHDRKRQREIEAAGWRFIRFGGQEIFQDVDKCVGETQIFIKKNISSSPSKPVE